MRLFTSIKLILSAGVILISVPTLADDEGSKCVPSGDGKCCFEGDARQEDEDLMITYIGKFVGIPRDTDCSKFTPFDVFELDEMGVAEGKETSSKTVNISVDESETKENDNSATKKMEKTDAR